MEERIKTFFQKAKSVKRTAREESIEALSAAIMTGLGNCISLFHGIAFGAAQSEVPSQQAHALLAKEAATVYSQLFILQRHLNDALNVL